MSHPKHRLRKAMEDHEYLAPNALTVYDRVNVLSQIYRRRRVIMQSAGSAVLGAGLLVGLVQMHAFIQGGAKPPVVGAMVSDPPSTPPPSPSPAASASPEDYGRSELDAFFNAGYEWDDAVKLARLWKIEDPTNAKIEAGRRLIAGQHLPL
ncbi:hypothetical protein [Actinoplanes sp. NPDC049265]|uniref:hypothetical protein n=1 Tax=Actinoplanes sp. NPDC049265 TaxID=3363902 RepID=UPI003723DD3A